MEVCYFENMVPKVKTTIISYCYNYITSFSYQISTELVLLAYWTESI